MIRSAPAAEREPPVGGPLPVDDQVPEITEGRPQARPIWSQAESGSGVVAIISEYTGAIARRWPGSCGV